MKNKAHEEVEELIRQDEQARIEKEAKVYFLLIYGSCSEMCLYYYSINIISVLMYRDSIGLLFSIFNIKKEL